MAPRATKADEDAARLWGGHSCPQSAFSRVISQRLEWSGWSGGRAAWDTLYPSEGYE